MDFRSLKGLGRVSKFRTGNEIPHSYGWTVVQCEVKKLVWVHTALVCRCVGIKNEDTDERWGYLKWCKNRNSICQRGAYYVQHDWTFQRRFPRLEVSTAKSPLLDCVDPGLE